MVDRHPSGGGKVAPCIERATAHRQCLRLTVYAAAEGRPRATVPGPDAEQAPGIERASAHRQRMHLLPKPTAEGGPGATVPRRDTVGRHAPSDRKVARYIHSASAHHNGHYTVIQAQT